MHTSPQICACHVLQVTDKDIVSPHGVLAAMEWLGEVLIQDSAHKVVLDRNTLDPVCVLLLNHDSFRAVATRHKQRLKDQVSWQVLGLQCPSAPTLHRSHSIGLVIA